MAGARGVADGLGARGFAAELLAVLSTEVVTGAGDVWLTFVLGAEDDEADALWRAAGPADAAARVAA